MPMKLTKEKHAFPAWSTIPGPRWLAMGRQWHLFFAWVFALTGLFTRRVEGMSQHRRDALDLAVFHSHRADGKQGLVPIGSIAPVKRRMGIENLQTAHDEDDERHGIDPMPDSH